MQFASRTAWVALIAGAAVSVAAGVRNALAFGQDLQWSPTTLFIEGINPFAHYLAGDPGGRIILEQAPSYAHGLYVLFVPLGLMSFADARLTWMAVNLALSIALPVWLARRAGCSRRTAWLLTFAFLASTAFRTNLANGQMAMLAVAGLSVAMFSPGSRSSLWAGIAFLKYSFVWPFAAWLVWVRGPRPLVLASVPGVLGFLVFLWWVGGAPLEVLWQPVQVASIAAYDGLADLMSAIARLAGRHSTLRWDITIPAAVSLGAAAAIARRRPDPLSALALLLLTSLLTFRHLIYDWVALLPACLWAIRAWPRPQGIVALLVIAHFWYGIRIVDPGPLVHGVLGWMLWAAIWHGSATDAAAAGHAEPCTMSGHVRSVR